jgi:hypothetical protein
MQIRKPRSWELPDSVVTPEEDYLRRRDFLRAVGLGVAATVIFPATIRAATAGFPDALDPAFKLDGVKLTSYNLITSYNNFYEWGLSKEDPQLLANRGWKTEPWTVEIGGLCAKPARFDEGDWDSLLHSFTKPFIWFGFSGLTILVILALTSNQWSIRKLGGKNWKCLHRLAYVAAALLIYHQAIAGKGHWYIARWLFFALVTLELARLAKTYLRSKPAPEPG